MFLFYAGIVLMALSAAGCILSAVIFRLSKKRLDQCLEDEYGKPRL